MINAINVRKTFFLNISLILPLSISLEQSIKWKGTAGMKGGLNSFLKSASKSIDAKNTCCLTSGPDTNKENKK